MIGLKDLGPDQDPDLDPDRYPDLDPFKKGMKVFAQMTGCGPVIMNLWFYRYQNIQSGAKIIFVCQKGIFFFCPRFFTQRSGLYERFRSDFFFWGGGLGQKQP